MKNKTLSIGIVALAATLFTSISLANQICDCNFPDYTGGIQINIPDSDSCTSYTGGISVNPGSTCNINGKSVPCADPTTAYGNEVVGLMPTSCVPDTGTSAKTK